VAQRGTVTKVLVANRGEIARRVIRTAREMGIGTVAVFSDADATAPHADEADVAVRLPGRSSADTYLRIDRLLDAAARTRADAVHPGYGFLSENAGFAQACVDAGLTWIGPPAAAIAALGSKVEAKQLMETAGVPVLPWTRVDTNAPGEALSAAAESLGYPILVKAAMGGGGRGMRVVRSRGDLADAVRAAQHEASAAFGDETVFLERFLEGPRHIEVQVVVDSHGTASHLFERECSVQRRYQKVIEEAPSPAVDVDLRAALCDAALACCAAVGYVGAGTVEFVVDNDRFYFLEVNTRIQVEHPVTEMVTGINLIRLQLCIARGERLAPEVLGPRILGHAIEARLYAEDPANSYLPTSGTLHRFRFPAAAGLRVDSAYTDGSTVGTDYDAMLAKIISWAPTREEAIAALTSSLEKAEIHGLTTNRRLLIAALRHPDFLAGRTDTDFLDRNAAGLRDDPRDDRALELHALAAVHAGHARARVRAPTPAAIPPSWRNVGPACQPATFDAEGRSVTVGNELPGVDVLVAQPSSVVLEERGVRYRISVNRVADVDFVDSVLGHTALHRRPRFPDPRSAAQLGSLMSPLPGGVVGILVTAGDSVVAGQPLIVIEAMKMQHTVRSPDAGTVAAVNVRLGDQVSAGEVLLVLDEAEEVNDE
jgi:acetyl/propionyl-CoA carboxylase alpha subunit